MNYSSFMPKLGGGVLAAITSLMLSTSVQAQTDYYFDPALTATGTGSGGTGNWDTGVTSNFYNGTSDTTFPAAAAGNADFDGVGGTITVNGSVDPAAINFDGSTAYTLSAGAAGSIDLGNVTSFNINNTGGAVTVSAPITFSGGSATSPTTGGNSISLNLNNSGSTPLVFASTVTNTLGAPNYPQFFELNAQSGVLEFNGNIKGANTGYDPNSGSPTNDNINVSGGATIYVDNGNFDRFQDSGTLLTKGAVTVTAQNNFTGGNGVLGGSTADLSTFTGNLANFGQSETLTAAAGGRVNFSGDIFGGGVGTGHNLVVNGSGIVAFTNPNGTDYASQYGGDPAHPIPNNNLAVGTEVAHGTLLLENSTGSATGAGFNQNGNSTQSFGSNNVVQVDSNATGVKATLGGYGYSLQQIVAAGPNSSLTPGDISKSGAVTPGTLHLDNGLTANLGVTVNLTLAATPAASSMIQLGLTTTNPYNGNPINGAPAFALTLNGPVSVNLSGPVNLADTYTMFYSTAGTAWNVSGATFAFSGVPLGYYGVESYVANSGGIESLDVSFKAVPEPSTYALMGLGMLFLLVTVRYRKLRV